MERSFLGFEPDLEQYPFRAVGESPDPTEFVSSPRVKSESDESGFDPGEYIPHRPPILGVDRILEIGEQSATSERFVEPGPDVCVDGYLWEEALIEGLAQTASALHAQTARREGRSLVRGMLVAVSHLTIHRRARVGERIQYRIDLTRKLERVSLVHGIARAGDEVLAEGELKFHSGEVS